MAAAVVGEAFLSAFIEVVLDKLASPHLVDLIRGKKFDVNLVQRLKNTLYAVEAVLNDAEQKQVHDSAVNKWLDDLKDALYVADDLLDRISTKAATTQKNKEVSTANYFSRLFNSEERDMVCKLEDIVARLEYILNFKDILGLQHIATHHSSWRSPSTSLEDRSNIFGRDQDKEAILKLLLDDDNHKDQISVIPIVGMGGVGKTTLAQSVYNHDTIKQKFNVQAWACVSDHFEELNVAKAILESIVGYACSTNNKELLHCDLKEKLAGKKFLIVLDDVWTEDYDSWNSLLRPLQYGAKGSIILVTTRIQKVASMVQTKQDYSLEKLSDEDCWSVFANHACLSLKEFSENKNLHRIGKEIVRKCKGLPLAAQSLGGLLRSKRDIKDWDNILSSNIWENESKIIPALRISYHYLPPYLKRCFVYCSLYPKDYEFYKDELVLLWMAEDLLHPSENNKTLEEVGYGYFNDLVSRSFFQRSGSGNSYQHFVMHDLVHDLAILLGGNFYFRTEELGKETKIGTMTRHLSFRRFSGQVVESFDIFGRAKQLRTFLTNNFKLPSSNIEKASCIILSTLNSFEASKAKIMDKKYLEELSFVWSQDAKDDFKNSQSEMDILGNLQPTKNLKSLSIHGYRGTKFPEWVADPSYHNLTKLSFYNCHNCCILPPLEQLRSLKKLKISRMSMMEIIGSEYGDCFSETLFPSLEDLEFHDMPCWEVWHPPSLTYLSLWKMSSLHTLECSGLLHLTSLRNLSVADCPKLDNIAGDSRLPASLLKLQIFRCPLLEERRRKKHPQIWPKLSHIPNIELNGRWMY